MLTPLLVAVDTMRSFHGILCLRDLNQIVTPAKGRYKVAIPSMLSESLLKKNETEP